MLVRPVMKRLFISVENQGKKGSLRSRASLLAPTAVRVLVLPVLLYL